MTAYGFQMKLNKMLGVFFPCKILFSTGIQELNITLPFYVTKINCVNKTDKCFVLPLIHKNVSNTFR